MTNAAHADLIHAKLLVKANHNVCDENGACLWSYVAGERYDVAAPMAKHLIAIGCADLVEVGPQNINGTPVSAGQLNALAKALGAAVPGVEPTEPEVAAAEPRHAKKAHDHE